MKGYKVMINLCPEAEKLMKERFGKDTVIALATAENGIPYVRYVNAYYENSSFYIITHRLSDKMKHIRNGSVIAIAGEWTTAHGKGIDLGYIGSSENRELYEKLKNIFCEWINNGDADLNDENTVILRVELTDGILLSHGKKYLF